MSFFSFFFFLSRVFFFFRSLSLFLSSFSSSHVLPPFFTAYNSGAVFGGYFSDCWTSSDDYKSSFKPFLFALSDDDDDDDRKTKPLEGREVFICEKVGGPEAALFDYGERFLCLLLPLSEGEAEEEKNE